MDKIFQLNMKRWKLIKRFESELQKKKEKNDQVSEAFAFYKHIVPSGWNLFYLN